MLLGSKELMVQVMNRLDFRSREYGDYVMYSGMVGIMRKGRKGREGRKEGLGIDDIRPSLPCRNFRPFLAHHAP